MLQINVAQMLKGAIGAERVLAVDDTLEITGYGLSHATGTVKLTRTNRSVLVQGELHTGVEVSCARCLELCSCPLKLNIEEEYFPITNVNSGVPLPSPDEVDAFMIDEHLILDLSEAVRQYTLLSIPMKPLCRVNCPGISVNTKTT
ncbi:MAG: DUF177 domain-containing protein [Dehalococcoidales bacterium]|nr:DUF177 domain-containing protein [Dehalococcoidales bacterium]